MNIYEIIFGFVMYGLAAFGLYNYYVWTFLYFHYKKK